ncbi:MAG: UPF0104 family protein [Betaproteobacteria bacterium]|nr:UPF0104 family protein [Betaproteobacteria bacterium]
MVSPFAKIFGRRASVFKASLLVVSLNLLAMIPITPGGVGFVEAGLVAMLTLAGIPGEQALLATLAYRVVSYWLPLPAGLVAHLLFRHRYGSRAGDTTVPST